MIVLRLVVVPGAAVGDVVLGADAESEQQRLIDLAVGDRDHLDAARQHAGDRRLRLGDARRIDEVAFVEDDEIGAGDLIIEYFLDRVVVRERAVGGALSGQGVEVVGDAAAGQRRAVDDDHDAVDSDAALDRRPMERLHQRLRQSEARGLDHDMLDAVARQDGVERRHEFVRDRAAQAAIGQFDDVLLGAGLIAAALEDFAVDADVAELVDDDGEAAALRVRQHVPDQRRLAGAEEAGDDGAGNAREALPRAAHASTSSKPIGGTRAMRPRLSGSGRPRQGRMPSAARASSRAPSTSAPAKAGSRPPKT